MQIHGTWWLSSKKDPRWNCSGTGKVGDFTMNPEATKALEEKKKELGNTPPDDLEWGYMKD